MWPSHIESNIYLPGLGPSKPLMVGKSDHHYYPPPSPSWSAGLAFGIFSAVPYLQQVFFQNFYKFIELSLSVRGYFLNVLNVVGFYGSTKSWIWSRTIRVFGILKFYGAIFAIQNKNLNHLTSIRLF